MICFVMTHEDFYKIYFVSAECIVISSCWLRPKFHKLLTMRQAASVSSVYNSRKGCTAQYLAGAGVQKPEYFTLTFLYIWGPVEQGQQCLVELGHKSRSYYPNCPSTALSLSRRKILQKLAFAISCLVWQPFSSNPRIQQNTKIVWQTKSQKNSPRMLFFLTISPNRGVVIRFKHEYFQSTLSQCQLQCKVVQMVREVNRMTNHNGRSALLRSVLCNNLTLVWQIWKFLSFRFSH